jgi:predicted O-methyltransferase YrrM
MFGSEIDAEGRFQIDGVQFRVDMSAGNDRKPSDATTFTIVKNKPYLDLYAELARNIRPKSILELGIFQGGSFVLLDKMFQPERIAAVDISPVPIDPLVKYTEQVPNRAVYFSTSQDDEAALVRIIETTLGGRLDLVVDDASHIYEMSRKSFEILFPRLSPGGAYVIEDWAWAHDRRYQAADHAWAWRPALTNLVFEIVALLGSTTLMSKISIHRPFVVITKSEKAPPPSYPIWSTLNIRGKEMKLI